MVWQCVGAGLGRHRPAIALSAGGTIFSRTLFSLYREQSVPDLPAGFGQSRGKCVIVADQQQRALVDPVDEHTSLENRGHAKVVGQQEVCVAAHLRTYGMVVRVNIVPANLTISIDRKEL